MFKVLKMEFISKYYMFKISYNFYPSNFVAIQILGPKIESPSEFGMFFQKQPIGLLEKSIFILIYFYNINYKCWNSVIIQI